MGEGKCRPNSGREVAQAAGRGDGKRRRLAKNLEKQRLQEKEEAERKAKKRTRPKVTSRAEKLQRAKKRELQAASERENARWEARVQNESKLQYAVRVKEAREAQIRYQKIRKRIQTGSYALFAFGAVAFLSDFFWGTASEGEDQTSQ
jgi:hypothetical protein